MQLGPSINFIKKMDIIACHVSEHNIIFCLHYFLINLHQNIYFITDLRNNSHHYNDGITFYLIHLLSHCLVISLSLNPSQHARPLTLK